VSLRAVQDYRLCRLCTERQGTEAEGVTLVSGADCYICEGVMDRIPMMVREVTKRINRYQFGSFAVGLSMPEGVQEREDEFRANLKIKGKETIRTQAARLIARNVASVVGGRVDKMKPELTAIVEIASGAVAVSSKPLFFYGRYTKPPGVSQKKESCRNCSGRGCGKCQMTGFERETSV